jgi:hypothetical protein
MNKKLPLWRWVKQTINRFQSQNKGLYIEIIEARNRIGGRIINLIPQAESNGLIYDIHVNLAMRPNN